MKDNNGNILFLILIAVALFATLSYVITSSSRNSDGNMKEKDKLAASSLIQYGANLETALSRIIVSGKFKPWQVDFRCSVRTYKNFGFCHGTGASVNCTSSECRIFNGGFTKPIVPDKAGFEIDSAVTNGYARRQFFHWIDVEGIGTEAADIVLVFYGVNDQTCKAINDAAGLGPNIITDTYPRIDFAGWDTPPPAVTTNIVGDAAPELKGKKFFCLDKGGGQHNLFHYVISEL